MKVKMFIIGIVCIIVMMICESLVSGFVNEFTTIKTTFVLLAIVIAPFFEEIFRKKGGLVFTIGLILIEGIGYSGNILEYSYFFGMNTPMIIALVLIWSSRMIHIMLLHININYGIIKAMIVHSISNFIILFVEGDLNIIPSTIISGTVITCIVVAYFSFVEYKRENTKYATIK